MLLIVLGLYALAVAWASQWIERLPMLAQAPHAGFEVAFLVRVGVAAEFHRLVERGHAGEGDRVAALEEELGVA